MIAKIVLDTFDLQFAVTQIDELKSLDLEPTQVSLHVCPHTGGIFANVTIEEEPIMKQHAWEKYK